MNYNRCLNVPHSILKSQSTFVLLFEGKSYFEKRLWTGIQSKCNVSVCDKKSSTEVISAVAGLQKPAQKNLY